MTRWWCEAPPRCCLDAARGCRRPTTTPDAASRTFNRHNDYGAPTRALERRWAWPRSLGAGGQAKSDRSQKPGTAARRAYLPNRRHGGEVFGPADGRASRARIRTVGHPCGEGALNGKMAACWRADGAARTAIENQMGPAGATPSWWWSRVRRTPRINGTRGYPLITAPPR